MTMMTAISIHRWDTDTIPACTSLNTSRTALRTRTRRVRTAVFAMSYTQVGVIKFIFDPIDSLDRIGDVREIDERTVPCKFFLAQQSRNAKRTSLLLFQEIHQFNISKFSKVPLEPFLCPHLKVLDIANVHIPCRSPMNRQCKSRRKRS